MNGRVYDPILGKFLSVDPIISDNNYYNGLNTYSYCRNNPLSIKDPDGNFPWSIVIGAVLGAIDGAIEYSNRQGKYWYQGLLPGAISGAIAGTLGMVGGDGLSLGANLVLGTMEGAVSGGVNAALFGRDPVISAFNGAAAGGAMAFVFSEQTWNLLNGTGFNSNQQVFTNFMKGMYDNTAVGIPQQDIIDYFGFDGVYEASNEQSGTVFEDGMIKPQIYYRDEAFHSYASLRNTYLKESYAAKRLSQGVTELGETDDFDKARWPEERLGVIHQFKNQGLTLNDPLKYKGMINDCEGKIDQYNILFYKQPFNYSHFDTDKWYNFIYRIPRRW